MTRIVLLFLVFTFAYAPVFSQSQPLWQTVFGGEQYSGLKANECPEDLPSGLVVAKDGGFIAVGSANNCKREDINPLVEKKKYSAAWAAKIASDGTPVWWKYLFPSKPVDMDGYSVNVHGFDSVRGGTLTSTRDGGFAVAGTIGSSTYNRKLSFARYDSSGELVADRFSEAKEFCDDFCGAEDPQIYHLQELSGEKLRALISVTHRVQSETKEGNTTVVKDENRTSFLYSLFGKDGSVKKSEYLPEIPFAPSAATALDEGIVVALSTDNVSGKESQRDVIVQRYDEDGKMLWKKRFGTPGVEDFIVSILKLSDGNLLFTGGISNARSKEAWFIKLSPKGETIWETKQKVGGLNFLDPIVESPDGGFLAALSEGEGPLTLIKLDSSGKKQWEKKHSQRVYFANNILKNEKGYVILGYTKKKPALYTDAILIQTDWNGNISKDAQRRNFP
ncbi:hypothetical protein EHQ12_11470 [Leptospira gomenensis]|uniref:Exo-alpha-sialidase n=1 Tax=Leptospira gomenensis TaxID=2484974 RepID=A0A5F1YB21_9LEPT|nr:hypothetical protein [Leptospira gomenensis]TGK33312.1 hypothetical protein EHQ17_10995 [Leptospira gomenensis]TGK37392.1 hypothetical protein EHQ12_11470 [Leptospira gomenensis]TGK50880.1 hypothetical protein EHQ07_03155 [Leptospira gomenensis]TGK56503.1 hypothetical protein EHQ13_15080 [Leptospira gomenensis]